LCLYRYLVLVRAWYEWHFTCRVPRRSAANRQGISHCLESGHPGITTILTHPGITTVLTTILTTTNYYTNSPWYNYYTNSPWYNYCTNYYTNYYTNSPWYNYQRLWFDMYSVLSMQCSIQIVMYVCMHKIAIYLPASGMNCWILSEKKINQLVYIFVLEHRDILRASGQWATCSKLSCSTAVVGNWTCSLCFDLSLKLAPFGRSYTTSYPTSY